MCQQVVIQDQQKYNQNKASKQKIMFSKKKMQPSNRLAHTRQKIENYSHETTLTCHAVTECSIYQPMTLVIMSAITLQCLL